MDPERNKKGLKSLKEIVNFKVKSLENGFKISWEKNTSELAYQPEMWVYYRFVTNCDLLISTRKEVSVLFC
jgi:hypothetical protein